MKKRQSFKKAINYNSNLIIVIVFLFALIPNSAYLSLASTVKNYFLDVSATMEVTPTRICLGNSVDITFEGTGGTGKYTFNYTINGDPNTTGEINGNSITIPYTPISNGDFNIVLDSVAGSDGVFQFISGQSETITVSKPEVDFTFTNNACSGTAVQFASDATGNGPLTYTWNFGDTDSSTIANPTHVFSSDGCGIKTFNVTLTVTDGFGCSSSLTKTISIKEKPLLSFIDLKPGPAGDFNNCGNNSSVAEYNIEVGNDNSSTCINSFDIDWGDGTPIQNIVSFPASHSYLDYGAFNMVITGIGANGCNNSVTYIVKNATNPSGGISTPGDTQNLCVPTAGIIFEITGWGKNTSDTTYEIDFGDNTSSVTYTQNDLVNSTYYNPANPASSANFPIAPHSYTVTSCPGEFTVQLWIRNACKLDPIPATLSNILIIKSPEAKFEATNIACENTIVDFINTTEGGFGYDCSLDATYIWDFGDGSSNVTTTTIQNVNHVFTSPGVYNVTLTAKNTVCDLTSFEKEICIEPPLTPQFLVDNAEGCIPFNLSINNTTDLAGSCGSPIYLWTVTYAAANCGTAENWSFTNATDENSKDPQFIFNESGLYTLTLTTTNSCGTIISAPQVITVKKPPTVTITPIATLCQDLPTTIINPIATVANCGTQTPLAYEWSFPSGTPATSTAADPGPISYSTSGTFPFSLKVTNECGSTIANSSFTINPTPAVDDITSQQKCNGQTSDAIVFAGSEVGAVYSWINTNPSIGLAATGSGNINPFSLTNTGTTVLTATITVTPSLNGCSGTAKTFDITVNPEATVNAISNLVLCNTDLQNGITFTSSAAGTTFSWTNNTSSIGLAASGTGNIPVFTAINAGTSPVVATITVTPTNALGCNGIPKTFTITVNPTPTPLVLTNQEYCNGVSTTALIFSNAVTGTTYTWTNSNTAIGLAASGTGNISSFIAENTGTSPILATISVTPTANGCPGTLQTFTITVNPSPVVNFSIANQTICSGDTSALVTLSSVAGATFNWTAIQPAGISGVSLNGTNTIPTQTLINSTNANIDVIYNAIATLASGATCTGALFPYTITVKPKPFIAANMTATICSDSPFTVSPTNGSGNSIPTGTTYSWAIPIVTGGLTGGIAGSNQTTISGTLTNPTNSVQTATYTVIPSLNGCSGSQFDVVVSVNPKPDVNATPNVVLCAGETSTQIDFTGNVAGATYTWSSNTTSIGIAASGTNTIPSFTAINAGTTPVIATITVAPSASTCTGLPKTFTITVNPTPTVNAILNLVKCNTAASGIISFAGNVTGTTFDWTNDNTSIGLAATGSGNIPSFITTNSGITPVIATITVSPKVNGCSGTPITFTITVNPTPTVDLLVNQTVCNGQQTTDVIFSGAIPNTTYNWTNSDPTIGLGANGVGDISPFTAINNGTNPVIASITVTPNLNGCSGASETFTITINPSPAVTFTPTNQILCSGSTSALVNLSSTSGGTNFTWTAVQPLGITGVSTSGTNTIPAQTLSNSTNLPIVVTYLATAESNSGVSCQGITYPYTITVDPVPTITTTQDQTICSNTTFSIIPLDGSGNSLPLGTTYSWGIPVVTGGITGGAALADQTTIFGTLMNPTNDVQTATYMVTPRSGTCTGSSFTVVITVNPAPIVLFSGVNQLLCSGDISNPIALTSSTSGNVTFNWIATIPTGITGASASGTDTVPSQTLENTTTNPLTVIYTATATIDNNGVSCTGEPFDYEITVNPAIITSSILSNYSGFNVSAVGASDGNINVTVTGGSGVYTYLWSGPGSFSATSQDISNVPAGVYSLTINDGLCSPITLNFTLTSPMPLLIQEDVAAHLDIFCFGYLTGVIKVDITQQSVGPYDYVLTLQGGGTIGTITDSALTNHTFTGLAAGIYDIAVTDANGSVKTILGVIITEPSGVTAAISAQTDVSCAGSATGSATVTASGGIGALTYSWNTIPIQTTATATGLTAGTYTVTITDANNCSIQKQAIITEPNAIVTSIASQTNVLCFGNNTGAVTVSVSGGTGVLSYSWDTIPVQTTTTVTGLIAGTYNLTVTDTNGCTKVQTVIITQPSAGLSSIISDSTNVSCFGGSNGNATATVMGGTAPYTYSWNTIPIQTMETATGLKAGDYSVLISDINGCSTSTTVTITEPVAMTASITAQTNVFCSGNSTGSATVTANGGTLPYSYSWNTTPIQTSDVAVNLTIGIYTVTITDAKGCATTTQATITEPNGIVTSLASQTNVDCFGNNTGAVTVLASGGAGTLSYSWDTTPIQTTPSLTGLVAGTYNLTVTDTNNCTKVQTVTISQPADIVITTDLEKDITCYNGSDGEIQVTINGGTLPYIYNWTTSDGSGLVVGDEDQNTLSAGTYNLEVEDKNGCVVITSYVLSEPSELLINLILKEDILCFGENTGSIEIAVVGGTPLETSPGVFEYQYNWVGPNGYTSNSQNIYSLIAGTYSLTVTDSLGCIQQTDITLLQPSEIIIDVTKTNVTCYGANDGSIQLSINGGAIPYNITWSNLGNGLNQNNLSGGIYTVTVIDQNNCQKTETIEITEPIFYIDPVVKQVSCFGENDGSIDLNITGGISPITIKWDDDSSAGVQRNNLPAGTYNVLITDSAAYQCPITESFTIIEPLALSLNGIVVDATDCTIVNSGGIDLQVFGGTLPYTYNWSNGSTTEDLASIPAGNYMVTVTDDQNCSVTDQFTLIRQAPLALMLTSNIVTDCDKMEVSQETKANGLGGFPPYLFNWSGGVVSGPNNEIMTTNQGGTYSVEITDSQGCIYSENFVVELPYIGNQSFDYTSFGIEEYHTLSIEDPIQFTNNSTGDYISIGWDFGDGSLIVYEENPVHTYTYEKSFVVTQTVEYATGCTYSFSQTLIVTKGYELIEPTGFTPNGDGINDTIRPSFKGMTEIEMSIYDTWGSLIYYEEGLELKGWDGMLKGTYAENGNYVMVVRTISFYGKKITETTPVTLVR